MKYRVKIGDIAKVATSIDINSFPCKAEFKEDGTVVFVYTDDAADRVMTFYCKADGRVVLKRHYGTVHFTGTTRTLLRIYRFGGPFTIGFQIGDVSINAANLTQRGVPFEEVLDTEPE